MIDENIIITIYEHLKSSGVNTNPSTLAKKEMYYFCEVVDNETPKEIADYIKKEKYKTVYNLRVDAIDGFHCFTFNY